MEQWSPVIGYEGLYEVSNEGNVKSLNYRHTGREKLLKPQTDKDGYLYVALCKDGKVKVKKIHRLVAQAFIPNPNGFTEVNHKDENPANDNVSNIEWCDRKYNNNYGTRTQRVTEARSKKVYQYSLNGELVAIWSSTREVGRNGFDQGAVVKCCSNKYHREGNNIYKNYIWKYDS